MRPNIFNIKNAILEARKAGAWSEDILRPYQDKSKAFTKILAIINKSRKKGTKMRNTEKNRRIIATQTAYILEYEKETGQEYKWQTANCPPVEVPGEEVKEQQQQESSGGICSGDSELPTSSKEHAMTAVKIFDEQDQSKYRAVIEAVAARVTATCTENKELYKQMVIRHHLGLYQLSKQQKTAVEECSGSVPGGLLQGDPPLAGAYPMQTSV